jgi:hypothetical protein
VSAPCEQGNEPSGSIKGEKSVLAYYDFISDFGLLS